jgi:hypothetical protein
MGIAVVVTLDRDGPLKKESTLATLRSLKVSTASETKPTRIFTGIGRFVWRTIDSWEPHPCNPSRSRSGIQKLRSPQINT